VVTISREYLSVYDRLLPGLELNKKQFARAEIDQLYLKRSASPTLGDLRPEYALWLLLQGGQAVLLLAGLKDWLAALYLEQQLEAGLGLADRPVSEEVSYLSPEERRQLLEWGALAESPNLAFVTRPGGGYYEGHYPKLNLTFIPRSGGRGYYEVHYLKGYLFQLDAFSQPYGDRFITYTRLRLIKAKLDPANLRPEEAPELKKKLTTEELIRLLLPLDRPDEVKGTIEIRPEADMIYYEQVGIETDLAYLEKLFDLLSQLAQTYPQILAWGGVAVPRLTELSQHKPGYLKAIAIQLIEGIQIETTQRLSEQSSQWWCPNCLVRRAGQIKIQDIWPPRYYYGCQLCGQSQTFFRGRVIAVLDQRMKLDQVGQKGVRRVNWLHYRTIFDFEEVEIVQATDEEAERFAVQVGNDTDPVRQPRYKRMRCLISSDCGLSENSLKILHRTFGRVEQQR
jgi:hypothetical protein